VRERESSEESKESRDLMYVHWMAFSRLGNEDGMLARYFSM